jgi:hypothetical protein
MNTPESEGAKCGTCGGTKSIEVANPHSKFFDAIEEPCPDCAEQVTDERLARVIAGLESVLRTIPPIQFTFPDRNAVQDAIRILRSQPGEREALTDEQRTACITGAIHLEQSADDCDNLRGRGPLSTKWRNHAETLRSMARERE